MEAASQLNCTPWFLPQNEVNEKLVLKRKPLQADAVCDPWNTADFMKTMANVNVTSKVGCRATVAPIFSEHNFHLFPKEMPT